MRAFLSFVVLPIALLVAGCRARTAPASVAVPLVATVAAEPEPPHRTYECRWVGGPITIDGKADEPAWDKAQVIDNFTTHWTNQPAKTKTKAMLLWDDENIYFFADMQDADLYADVDEHDGGTWNNDVFELFFKPSDAKLGYYEFEISAKNTVMDMYLPSRGSGGYARWVKRHKFNLKTAVGLRGTLNNENDDDDGWSVEGKIPWSDFALTGGKPKAEDIWKFVLTRYDYSKNFSEPNLTACAPLTRPDYHHYEDYEKLRFVGK